MRILSDKTGGPAFPQFDVIAGDRDGHGDVIDAYTTATGGLTLRDYFAAAALTGLLAYPESHLNCGTASQAAKSAFEIADAMIAARQEPQS